MAKPDKKNLQLLQELYQQGLNLLRAGQPDVAIFSFESALQIAPRDFDILHMLGIACSQADRTAQAFKFFEQALALNPASAPVHMNYGIVLKNAGKMEQALDHIERAARLTPTDANVQYNLANAYRDAGNPERAIAAYRSAIRLRPGHPDALNNLGQLLEQESDYAGAAECCAELQKTAGNFPYLPGRLYRLHTRICNWDNYQDNVTTLLEGIGLSQPVVTPFTLLTTPADRIQQRRNAGLYARQNYPLQAHPLWSGEVYSHPRIRIAYLSSDFFAHATSYLLAEVLERHDRERFEIFAFSFGHTRHDSLRQRIENGVEHFIDVSDQSDQEIAQTLRQTEIDIAIDLKGYTEACRTGILACRPAPIQINYLGFPGTMGADYIDYIVGDPVLIPPDQEDGYSEKILRLPDSYQPNDPHRAAPVDAPSRSALGLPEKGFVFCCFNNSVKITPAVFDIWMHLLGKVEGSVLWLFEDTPNVVINLRRQAELRGVDGARIIFAPRTSLAEHLARHTHADLFLDTFPFNAHTTASDALLSGLPVVTCAGGTFASRVAASLLRTVGLEELITNDFAAYESLALALALKPERLQAIRQTLLQHRLQSPLFDSARYTRNFEHLLSLAHRRYLQGLPPENIDCPTA